MSVVTPEAFIAAQAKKEHPVLPEQLEALKTLLTNPAIPISKVAEDLTAPVLEHHQKTKQDPNISHDFDHATLWESITDAVKQLTDFNDRLVDLVVAIQKIPDPEGHYASMVDYTQYWTEFAYDFKVPRSNDPDREAKAQAWVNINAFCAKISTRRIPVLDERERAAWVLKETLERAPWEEFHHSDLDEKLEEYPDDEVVAEEVQYELECRDVRVLEYWAPAAAVWMKIDAKGIYDMEGKISDADEQDWYPTTWKGPKGWSKERFAYWIERFEWISKVTALKMSTRKDAADAAESMKKVVKGN